MALKVVHIDKKRVVLDAEAIALWEEVLKPKWEGQAKRLAEEVKAELEAGKGAPVRGRPAQKTAGRGIPGKQK
jgi:hypothetical protein